MKIAVLAVQGAFIEHEKVLESLGAECMELAKRKIWSRILMVWCFLVERVPCREN